MRYREWNEERNSYSGTQALPPDIGVLVLFCLTRRKMFLGNWIQNNNIINSTQLSVPTSNMLRSFPAIHLKEVTPTSHSADGPTPSFNKQWAFIHNQSLSAIIYSFSLNACFWCSFFFFYDYLTFIYMALVLSWLHKLT